MDIIYCQKCHNKKRVVNYQKAKIEIAKALNVDVEIIEDGCPSFCGPGANNHFVEIDGELIYDPTFEGLISKLKEL